MVDILLAAYNGEKYIARQLDSIIAQTYKNWRLIIQDDCSSDKTAQIVNEYTKKYPQKIKLHINEKPSGSAKSNFFDMLKYAENEYVMFCDQDDFWLENKIEISVNAVKQQEKVNGGVPLLIHTDLKITDSELNVLNNSFFKYQGLNYKANTLGRLLVQNNATGCTMLINKELLEIIKGNAECMLMHDWWLALIASAFGKIHFINESTVLYRQHGNNQLGAVNNRSISGAVKIAANRTKTKKRVSVTYAQAEAFLKIYKDSLSIKNKEAIEYYISIPDMPKIKRVHALIKRRYLKQNILAAAGQLIFC